MSFSLSVRQLALFGYHGVYADEQAKGQRFLIDLECDIADETCLHSDDITTAVSYADLVAETQRIFTTRRFNLIEALACHIADMLLANFPPLRSVSVAVHKPAAPLDAVFEDVVVTVKRQRND